MGYKEKKQTNKKSEDHFREKRSVDLAMVTGKS